MFKMLGVAAGEPQTVLKASSRAPTGSDPQLHEPSSQPAAEHGGLLSTCILSLRVQTRTEPLLVLKRVPWNGFEGAPR